MIDLEARVARWRREREAIPHFNFKPENLDDLEDELRFEIEHSLKEGATPDEAWVRGLRRIGQSLSTTRDFVRMEFLPALRHLLVSWGKPALLVVLLFATLWFYETPFTYLGIAWPVAVPLALVTLATALFFLPGGISRKAILLGLGNVALLLPIFYGLLRPPLAEWILGTGWDRRSLLLGLVAAFLGGGIVLAVNFRWWKRQEPEGRRWIVFIAGTLFVLLVLAPFCSVMVGNASIREIYHLPTPAEVPWINEARGLYQQWKFPRVLVDSMFLITSLLPAILSVLLWALLRGSGALRMEEGQVPQRSDGPGLMVLFSFGIAWIVTSSVEITFTNQMREAEAFLRTSAHFMKGLETSLLFVAIVYLLSSLAWTLRLRRATEIRPFYGAVVVLVQMGVIWWVTFEQKTLHAFQHEHSRQPLWLSWLLGLAAVALIVDQIRTLWIKWRTRQVVPSRERIDGTGLVQAGLALGAILSWSWLILIQVAVVMAYDSVAIIHAMVSWGTSITDPAKNHFNLQDLEITGANDYWGLVGVFYLGWSLLVGLILVMVLSGLEFLRFQIYRLHQVRRAARKG